MKPNRKVVPVLAMRTGKRQRIEPVDEPDRREKASPPGPPDLPANQFRRRDIMPQLKIEILQEIQTSISQLENGMGVAHNEAKEMILKSMANGRHILPVDEIVA